MKKFPENFLWGAAASAPQTEGAALLGGKSPSTWDVWYDREPDKFFNHVGPTDTSNTYEMYREDISLMAQMNLNSYRTSIAWTRLLPDGQTINQEAVDFYRDYFTRLAANGIEPIINLFHFDMPWWLMEKGGWENREAVDAFAFYAKTAYDLFGDIVKKWTTFNEPMVHIECGYLGDAHYPGLYDIKKAIQVGYHTILAHKAAVKAFRESECNGQIGIILNLSPVYAKNDEQEQLMAKEYAELFYINSLLDPVVHGEFPQKLVAELSTHHLLPDTFPEDKQLITAYPVDFLGVNYYQPLRVQKPQKKYETLTSPAYFFSGYDWPDKKMNPHRGWEIYERGMYDIALKLKQDYGNLPWFISENGMGVADEEKFMNSQGIIEDDYRIDFIQGHLLYLHQAIQEGANCFGYHLWTFVDCWSWLNGYKNRYGFYRVDITDDFKRTPKKSSFWMAAVIENNGLF